jgi:cell division septum initiation protein DivIVA
MYRTQIRTGLVSLITASTILVAGCGKSGSDQLDRELKQVASWAATARMVADSWSNGTVPAAYARRTLETLSQQLQMNAEKIQSISRDQNSPLAHAVEQIQQTIAHLQAAVIQQDRNWLTELTSQLDAEQKVLTSIRATSPTANPIR